MDELRRPQDVVALGYDRSADAFAEWKSRIAGLSGPRRARELLELLPERPDVLELCCGGGVEETRLLAAVGRLVGVDISAEQLGRARERVPDARFIHADVTEVEFTPESFDAVVSFYAFNHIPRVELGPLLRRMAGWLRPGGYLMAAFGSRDTPDCFETWLDGVETFFSGYEPPRTLALVHAAGLEVVHRELETIVEPEGPGQFLWVLARKRSELT